MELEALFAGSDGAPVACWHDTGHAHAQEELGILERGGLLAAFGGQLAGMHPHDAAGLEDHLPPGSGEIDLSSLDRWLSDDVPVVLELKPGTGEEEVRAGIDWWRNRPVPVTEDGGKPSPPLPHS